MRDGKLKIEFTASEKFKSRWEPLGFACSLIAHSELHSKFPISYISKVINAAIKHRFIKFYFNSEGNAIGYVIWAYLAPDVEQKVMRTGHWNLHESEWNEGDSLWIVDLLAPYGDIGMILADLRDGVFASANEASYLRLKKDRAIGKQVARESCSYFFTRGQKKSRRLLSVPASNDVAVDVSNIIIKDTRTPLPPDWHISGAFMEIYVRGYSDSNGDGIGDLQGLIQKLPYLKDLGIKGIWLMPVNQSEDNDHGYAVSDYRAIESDYGTMADFDALITAAHALGIGVIMDYVINHSAYSNPLFIHSKNSIASRFRDWYVWSDKKPEGWSIYDKDPWYEKNGAYYFAGFWNRMPDFNFRNEAVINYHHNNMRFWLNRGVDGFRFDAVGNLVENGPDAWESQPESYAIMAGISALLKKYQHRYMVGEATNDPIGFGASTVCGSAFAFGHNNELVKAALGDTNAIKAIAAYPTRAPESMATFLGNHDSVAGQRIFDQFDGDLNAYKLAAATYLLQPGIPFIYYGEEIGMAGGTGLRGDWQIRTPMSWSGDIANAGFTEGAPFRALATNVATNNVESQLNDPTSLYAFYKAMLSLRNAHFALSRGSYEHHCVQGKCLSFQRNFGNDQILILINYGQNTVDMPVSNLPLNASLTALYPVGTQTPPESSEIGDTIFALAMQSIKVIKIEVNLTPPNNFINSHSNQP